MSDFWKLLEEAYDLIREYGREGDDEALALANRIFDVLEEHEKPVKWEDGISYDGKRWWDTQIDDRIVHIEAWDREETRFYWRVSSMFEVEGHKPTLEEAKEIAVDAAKRVR